MSPPPSGTRYLATSSIYGRSGRGIPSSGEGDGWFLELPGPPNLQTDRVWHYTDRAGLLGILQSQRLWATSARMLNDSTEIEHGLDLYESALKSVLETNTLNDKQRQFIDRVRAETIERLDSHELYVACASLAGDDLSQWRGYAGGSGFAVALNPHVSLVAGVQTMFAMTQWPLVEWRPVVYEPDSKSELMKHVAEFIAASTPLEGPVEYDWMVSRTVAVVLDCVARVKHQGFAPEREVRLVIGDSRLQPFLQFRAGAFGPTPYVEVGSDPTGGIEAGSGSGPIYVSHEEPGPLPILEVAIGPAQEQRVAEGGVHSLLKTIGREDIRVSRSNVPYR